MRTAMLLVGLLAMGCGGDDGSAASCSPDDRTGTYLMHFTTVSGDCGDFPDTVARLESAAMALPAGCVFIAPDR